MLHSIQYSIIRHLKSKLPELTNVVWLYNGVNVTKEKFPFVTVENLITSSRVLDKLYQYEADTYNFQIGAYSATHSENAKLGDKIKRALMKEPIELFDTDVNDVIGSFRVDVTNIMPITTENIESETSKHRRYIDATVLQLKLI
jgi:hypothetical protein